MTNQTQIALDGIFVAPATPTFAELTNQLGAIPAITPARCKDQRLEKPSRARRVMLPAETYAQSLPATRWKNGRWTFDPADLPVIADRLGLTTYACAA